MISEFDSLDARIPSSGRYLFRGQSNTEWFLLDSLSRLLAVLSPASSPRFAEQLAYRRFVGQAHLFLDPSTLPGEKSLLTWWALMQHFGCPTRLLDWTASPYVAAYFAVSDNLDRDGAIWAFDAGALARPVAESGGESIHETLTKTKDHWDVFWGPFEHKFVHVFTLKREHTRTATQQGVFSVCTPLRTNHGDIIDESLETEHPRSRIKFVIEAELKREILNKLMTMTITASSLFPGLDGLGRSIREYLMLEIPHLDLF
jgi:hypothetical protein